MANTLITSFSQECYELYGRNFISSFLKWWRPPTTLFVYYEGARPADFDSSYVIYRDLLEVSACKKFLKKHRDDRASQGRQQLPGQRWKRKAVVENYNFRFDAYKFSRKIFAINDAAKRLEDGVNLHWIDADVIVEREPPRDLFNRTLPDGYWVSRLWRGEHYHSECGFVSYRLPEMKSFLQKFEDLYSSGEVYDLKEWHDSWVFDWLIKEMGVPVYNLTPGKSHRFVFERSILGRCMSHLKGDRKHGEIT